MDTDSAMIGLREPGSSQIVPLDAELDRERVQELIDDMNPFLPDNSHIEYYSVSNCAWIPATLRLGLSKYGISQPTKITYNVKLPRVNQERPPMFLFDRTTHRIAHSRYRQGGGSKAG